MTKTIFVSTWGENQKEVKDYLLYNTKNTSNAEVIGIDNDSYLVKMEVSDYDYEIISNLKDVKVFNSIQ